MATSSLLLAVVIGGVVAVFAAVVIGIQMMRGVTSAQTVKLDEIHILVDGRYSQVLQELADVKQLLAVATGGAVDQRAATIAQQNADAQAARVAESRQFGKG